MEKGIEGLIWVMALVLAGLILVTVERPLNLISVGIILLIASTIMLPAGRLQLSKYGGLLSGFSASVALLFGVQEHTDDWPSGIITCIVAFVFVLIWYLLVEESRKTDRNLS
jgi:hypothetical protein